MLIHIGFHKTGTTWLQQRYFSRHPGLSVAMHQSAVWEQLVRPHALVFDAAKVATVESAPSPVISSERLSGNPHSGGYDSKEIADRLFATFPHAKILVVIREQRSMLNSLYRQYVRAGGVCRLREYLDPVRDGRMPLFRYEFLQYHHLIEYYQATFGEHQVCVLPYELFDTNRPAFLNAICDYAGVEHWHPEDADEAVNPSDSDLVTCIKMSINRWHGGDSLYPVTPLLPTLTGSLLRQVNRLNQSQWISKRSIGYASACADFADGKYEESNKILQKLVTFDLADYGYSL